MDNRTGTRKGIINADKRNRMLVILPLLEAAVCHALGLVDLGGISGGLERVAGGGERFEVCAVVLMGLIRSQHKRKNG